MAGINTRIVRRSNTLSNFSYGKKFQYDEAVMTGKGVKGRLNGIILSIPLIFLAANLDRLLIKFLILFHQSQDRDRIKKRGKMDILVLDFLFLTRKAMNQFLR